MNNDRYVNNAIVRAGQILESFTCGKTSYTNNELSKKLGLNKSTLMRIMFSLEKAGLLERNVKTGEYRLTHKLFQIGSVYIQGVSLHKEAMPILAELALLFQETVHLAILTDFEVLYLDKIECSQSIGMMSSIGIKCPAYCTGVGKAMLAYCEEKDLETFFRKVELKSYTPNTITDPEELKIHLNKIKIQGFAIDDSEHEFDVTCVAAPIMNKDEKVIASISVSGPAFRMSRERMNKEIMPRVKESAANISHRLGYFAMDIDSTPTSVIPEKLEESFYKSVL